MVTFPHAEGQEQPRLPVPPITDERHVWVPSDPALHSRSEFRRQSGPYASAVPAGIADWRPAITADLGADIEDATRALIEFDQHAATLLGPDATAIGPMTAILLRTESASSSQIEQLTVGARQLALAEIDAGDSPNSREVIGNVRAMEAALSLADDLTLDSLLIMHRELLRHQRGMEHHAGSLREELVWIGRGSAGPRTADFVPPQPIHIAAALDDLFEFVHRTDLSVLVLLAVAHAQFETIHPFVDGNGRSGRALVQALLRASGITTHVTVPLSAGLLRDTSRYFAALTEFRAGDAEPICRSFAQAARYAAHTGRGLIDHLNAELEASRRKLTGVRRHAIAWKLLPHLIGQPVVNSTYVQQTLGASAMSANRALDVLTARGVLAERTGRRRGRIWQHTGILAVLDGFADSVRRDSTRP
ncbi:Fic family protein [Leucobacter sp. GX24907]